MINTSVILILRSLSPSEIKEFDKFIISPFFNNQPSLTRFYKALKKHYPGFDEKKIDRKEVFRSLYPDKPYKDDVIRRLTSDLKKLFDSYMYNKVTETNPIEAGFLRSFEYIRRGLVKESEKELEQINRNLHANDLICNEYVKNRLDYEDRFVQIKLSTNRQSEISGHFMSEIEYLIYHFILRLAYYLHNIRANRIIFNISDNKFINDFISLIDLKKIDELMSITGGSNNIRKAMRVYVLFILNNLYEDNETYFIELKELLPEAINYFQEHEKYNVYQIAESICWVKMAGINRERYRRELFEINKMRLDAGVYMPDGKSMRLLLYRQVLTNALQINEVDWAEEFVEKYSEKLPVTIRENMTQYAKANLLFERGRFEESLALLNKVDFDIFTLKYDVKNLTLRNYIELSCIEEALSLIDTYKHFIAKNKGVSEYYREITENFLKYCKYLIDLKNGSSKRNADDIMKELESDNTVNFKQWFIKKLIN